MTEEEKTEALAEALAAEDIPKGMWKSLQDKGRYRRYARIAERFLELEKQEKAVQESLEI